VVATLESNCHRPMPRKVDAPTDSQPEFSIEDTDAARVRMRKDLQPYALFDGKKGPPRKRKDLRKLNEWIKAQRLAETEKQAPAADSRPPRKTFVLFMPLRHLMAVIASALCKLAGK
jgi:hypothetical protein